MLSLSGNSPIFLYYPPTDMRKSFHGLSALVYQHLGNPEDGAYYVFVNRPRTHVKILYFDGDGLVLWYKRLEAGRFVIPEGHRDKIEMDRRQLSMLLEGVIPLSMKKRYSREKNRKKSEKLGRLNLHPY